VLLINNIIHDHRRLSLLFLFEDQMTRQFSILGPSNPFLHLLIFEKGFQTVEIVPQLFFGKDGMNLMMTIAANQYFLLAFATSRDQMMAGHLIGISIVLANRTNHIFSQIMDNIFSQSPI